MRLGLIGGLSVAVMLIVSTAARSPGDIGAVLETLVATLVPVGLVAFLAARTNRRRAGPSDVPWSPPPVSGKG
ncbi:MAG TPA: hypothetical protein VFW92_03450 [Candidatus Limnocylindrales bacterium]|nr:hypothetical protein [Candidatus Limnocylindrales bacterium]